jgi:hypothetical protein
MAWSGLSIAVLSAAFVSVRYAQLSMIASAALVGSGLTSRLAHQVLTVRSLTPAFVQVMGGCALVSAIEPQEPLTAFAILPLLPLLVMGLLAWTQTGLRVGRVSMVPWVPAMGITALAAFWMYLATQAETPAPPESDEPALLEEEFFP